MRGKVAKKLRRLVYGDYSIREKQYVPGRNVLAGRRATYQTAKKNYKNARRDGIKIRWTV